MTTRFDYLIVGGGMTADAAARGVRELDTEGTIGIIGQDTDPPYTRPALTKKLWTDPDFSAEDNWLHTGTDTGAELRTGTRVTRLDVAGHTVVTDDGEQIGYRRLLLATGGTPHTLDIPAGERCLYFRTFADYRGLRAVSGAGRHVAVVGGSFIATELAAALVQNETATTVLFAEDRFSGGMFPAALAEHLQSTYADRGVQLRPQTTVDGGTLEADGITLQLSDGSTDRYDALVAGLGIEPAVDLAAEAGLEVDDGILVDAHLWTGAEDVYAAGDVARYPDRLLGRQRVEHVDNATQMGAVAGRILAGSDETYDHTPYFYSNVFDISYQAVGTLDPSAQTIEDWVEPMEQGTVYYLRGDQLIGVLLWNIENRLDDARVLLAGDRYDRAELVGAIRP
ncbi:MAG TPA: FAD/NAD(P)-binding oxidoreductase [Ruania sp.]|nr:FAD/NAD(P)-binding oxidoreductase [Ruania sp.]